jgi:hypothetical protein
MQNQTSSRGFYFLFLFINLRHCVTCRGYVASDVKPYVINVGRGVRCETKRPLPILRIVPTVPRQKH